MSKVNEIKKKRTVANVNKEDEDTESDVVSDYLKCFSLSYLVKCIFGYSYTHMRNVHLGTDRIID